MKISYYNKGMAIEQIHFIHNCLLAGFSFVHVRHVHLDIQSEKRIEFKAIVLDFIPFSIIDM